MAPLRIVPGDSGVLDVQFGDGTMGFVMAEKAPGAAHAPRVFAKRVEPGGQAERGGVRAGDTLVHVNGTALTGVALGACVALIKAGERPLTIGFENGCAGVAAAPAASATASPPATQVRLVTNQPGYDGGVLANGSSGRRQFQGAAPGNRPNDAFHGEYGRSMGGGRRLGDAERVSTPQEQQILATLCKLCCIGVPLVLAMTAIKSEVTQTALSIILQLLCVGCAIAGVTRVYRCHVGVEAAGPSYI
jgi:hypothetical protein